MCLCNRMHSGWFTGRQRSMFTSNCERLQGHCHHQHRTGHNHWWSRELVYHHHHCNLLCKNQVDTFNLILISSSFLIISPNITLFYVNCLSGPKFDIAVEMFCMVEFLNSLLGQKFVAVKFKFSIRSEICHGRIRIFYQVRNLSRSNSNLNFAKGAHLQPCQTAPTYQSLTLFCMN